MPEAEGGPLAKLRPLLADSCGPRLGVQLRAKNASAQALLGWGRELRAQTSESGSALAVNSRADVAAIIAADAIHLPEAGVPVEAVRTRWPSVWIGVSRHDRDGLHEAATQGATYAFLGPVFDVPGKNPSLGIDGFRRAREGLTIPVFALGGIEPEHVEALTAAGAAGVAVRRSIYQAADPAARTRAYLRKLDKAAANVG